MYALWAEKHFPLHSFDEAMDQIADLGKSNRLKVRHFPAQLSSLPRSPVVFVFEAHTAALQQGVAVVGRHMQRLPDRLLGGTSADPHCLAAVQVELREMRQNVLKVMQDEPAAPQGEAAQQV